MRTPEEFIKEVQEQTWDIEGTDCWTEAFLEVWFETTRSTLPVCGCNPNGLEELKSMVELGGRPIGVIHIECSSDRVRVWSRPTVEYEDESWVADILNPLVEKIADDLADEDFAGPGIVASN